MQSFLQKTFQSIKSQLCGRRNTQNRPRVNRFAVNQNASVIVQRRTETIVVDNNDHQDVRGSNDQSIMRRDNNDNGNEIEINSNSGINTLRQQQNVDEQHYEQQQQKQQQHVIFNVNDINIDRNQQQLQSVQQQQQQRYQQHYQEYHHTQQYPQLIIPSSPQQSQQQTIHHKPSSYKITLPQGYFKKIILNQQQSQHQSQQQTRCQQLQSQMVENMIQTEYKIRQYQNKIYKCINRFYYLEENDNKRMKLYWQKMYNIKTRSRSRSNQSNKSNLSSQSNNNINTINNNNNITHPSPNLTTQQLYIHHCQQQHTQTSHHQPQSPNTIQYDLQSQYYQDITSTRQLKYTKQLTNYPQISIQTYKQIKQLWAMAKKYPNNVIRTMQLNFLTKLTARSYNTLSIGKWLNDEIINGYLQMIDKICILHKLPYRVLNSFFAETTFSKSQQVIKRVLKRKHIQNTQSIVIAINTGNHWLFAQITQGTILIRDSIKKCSASEYQQQYSPIKGILANIKSFAEMFYGQPHIVRLDQYYPQQQNGSDCGMFLLCGIKDLVRNQNNVGWTFCKNDINYKRYQVAREMLQQTMEGFQKFKPSFTGISDPFADRPVQRQNQQIEDEYD